MTTKQTLLQRSESKCELCNSEDNLSVYEVPPNTNADPDNCVLLCDACLTQINDASAVDANHWRCLNDAMWKPVPAVQVMSWRMLKQLSQDQAWAQDLLDMLYLDDETQAWAEATMQAATSDNEPSFDSNGAQLFAGDSVTLIKDLDVKGANFTAKRGTLVKNISLTDNPEHIEGRVNGTRLVLLTKFLKKAN
ncbi:MAG: PhnA domain-containing protein [Gammaproteobacteria bacterium]|nr:PhnA domain-containing protein [Gammaproteobacteria bacterium]